ncbi:unnamed protein product [Adineta ricciae]|uniref:Uncharacterized protein n=1 Tax=Adineta ricciae TaxID=249248 RepID=A0A814FJI0_ADIRI|nr:unnamed protein product [Adineta ricciae]
MIVLCSSMINAQYMPFIRDARYNKQTKTIDIQVQYSGGCAEHEFQLKVGSCRETYPVQCDAKLIDLTVNDYCDAIVSREVSISTQSIGLDDGYYAGATIQIYGGANTKAKFVLS